VFPHCIAEYGVGRQFGRVERGDVQVDEPLALLLGDLQAAVHRDQVGESDLSGEAVRAAERFSGKRGEVVHMCRPSSPEQRLQQRIAQHAVVEGLLQAM